MPFYGSNVNSLKAQFSYPFLASSSTNIRIQISCLPFLKIFFRKRVLERRAISFIKDFSDIQGRLVLSNWRLCSLRILIGGRIFSGQKVAQKWAYLLIRKFRNLSNIFEMSKQKHSLANQIRESKNPFMKLKPNRRIVKFMQDPNQPLYYMFIQLTYFAWQGVKMGREWLKPVVREISFFQEFTEPEILRVEKQQILDDYVYMVHERIDNILSIIVDQLSYPQKISLFYDVVKGVKAIHGRRIVHRGIQPSIIGVCQNQYHSQAKIISFQYAIVVNKYGFIEGGSETAEKFGNNCYTAPEILMGKNYSFASDIWSLGMLLYELLFGQQMIIKVKKEGVEMQLPEKIPLWLKDFLNKMLVLNPEERYPIQDIEMISRSAMQCSGSTDIHQRRF